MPIGYHGCMAILLRQRRCIVLLIGLIVCLGAEESGRLLAQAVPPSNGASTGTAPNSSPAPEPPSAAWKLERVTLVDGKVCDGLIAEERPARIDFIEVNQPAGKPI